MRVSYGEGIASHTGPESCGCVRKGAVEALTDFGEPSRTGVRAGWVLSPVILKVRDADALMSRGRPSRSTRQREGRTGLAIFADPRHARKHLTREAEPSVFWKNCGSDSATSTWNCMPTKRG